jgi:hypothetical protein
VAVNAAPNFFEDRVNLRFIGRAADQFNVFFTGSGKTSPAVSSTVIAVTLDLYITNTLTGWP